MIAPHNKNAYTMPDGDVVLCDKITFISAISEKYRHEEEKRYWFKVYTISGERSFFSEWVSLGAATHKMVEARKEIEQVKDNLVKYINAYVPTVYVQRDRLC
jgi:hypothetical protein